MAKAENYFAVGKNNIFWLDPDFKKHFYGMELKKGEGELLSKDLKRPMTFQEMKDDFNAGEVELGDIDLESKSLLINGNSNIFFVKDKEGVISAVFARRHPGGWCVHVGGFADADRWRVEDRVSFRNLGASLIPDIEVKIGGKVYKLVEKI